MSVPELHEPDKPPVAPAPTAASVAPSTRPPRKRRRRERRGVQCLNCDTFLTMEHNYCPHCGQENVPVNISIWLIFREAMDEFIRFDSKMVRTLVPLVIKPGELTREWGRGRRARYVSPLKLYLTITFLFFLIFPLLHPPGNLNLHRHGVQDAFAAVTDDEDSAHALLPLHSARPTSTAGKATLATPSRHPAATASASGNPAPAGTSKAPKPAATSGKIKSSTVQLLEFFLGLGTLANDPNGGRRVADHFISHLPTAIFLMLPIFAGALWVLYIRNGRYYVEHLVFALHCHAFYFLLMLAIALLPSGGGSDWVGLGVLGALIIVPVYSLLALKRAFGQGWLKTIVKWFMLGFAYSMLLALSLMGALLYSAYAAAAQAA